MKLTIPLSLIVLAGLGLGFVQHSRLTELQREGAMLREQSSAKSSDRQTSGLSSAARSSSPEAKPLSTELPAGIEPMILHTLERLSKVRGRGPADPTEQAEAMADGKVLLAAFAGLDHRAVYQLIHRMKLNESVSTEMRENLPEFFVEIMLEANRKEAFALLEMLPELANRENFLSQAFYQWASANPTEALRWFTEESKKGNPLAASPGLLNSAMLVLVRVDPARALTHDAIEKWSTNPDKEAHLGSSIAAILHDAREHAAFLAALRHEQEKSPGSTALAKIRADYMGELSGRMHEWTFAEASGLIDSEFTPSEKLVAVERISHVGDLAEPALWADWFARIEVPEGTRHPLLICVDVWMRSDSVAAGRWLEQAPSSDIKDHLVFNYAFLLMDKDPPSAMQWALKLADDKLRIRALKELAAKWQSKDPPAAAAFAKEHGMSQ